MRYRAVALIATAALAIAGLSVPTSATAADLTISGVISGEDGPLPNVIVGWVETVPGGPYGIDESDHFEVISNDDGSFSLDIPADIDPYYIYVNHGLDRKNRTYERTDYLRTFQGADGDRAVISGLLDPIVEPLSGTVDFDLDLSGTISGAVIPDLIDRGGVDLVTLGGTTVSTDYGSEDDGSFSFTGLAPGSYRITSEARDIYLPFTSPVITVKSGLTTEYSPVPDVGGTITGTVTADGAPLMNVVVVAVLKNSTSRVPSVESDDQGAYSFDGLEPGDYSLSFTPRNPADSGRSYLTKTATVTRLGIGKTVTVDAALGRAGSVTGAARVKYGAKSYKVSAVNSAGSIIDSWGGEGDFILEGLPKGTYRLYFTSAGSKKYYAARTVKVTGSIPRSISRTSVRTKTLTFSGVVRNGDRGSLYLISSRHGMVQTQAGTDGSFSFAGLIPGKYTTSFETYQREPATTEVTLTKSTRKTLERGLPFGRLSAEVTANGVPVRSLGVYYNLGAREAMLALIDEGTLDGTGPSGVLKSAQPGFSMGDSMSPYWYDLPESAKTVTIRNGKRTSLGDFELVLHGG